jgi:hypothetical protein
MEMPFSERRDHCHLSQMLAETSIFGIYCTTFFKNHSAPAKFQIWGSHPPGLFDKVKNICNKTSGAFQQ